MSQSPAAQPGNGKLGVRLAGTGMAVPARVVTNDQLTQTVDTSDEWIVQRTGIRQRHLIEDDRSLRDLCVEALTAALNDAGLKPDDLDQVIVASITSEMCCPSTSARVVADIGAGHAGALDISAACSGWVYGINMAEALIRSGMHQHIAVIGAETLSRITDWSDRRTCVLFGDGAGAAIFSPCDDPSKGCQHQTMGSDGSMWTELYCPRKETDIPANDKIFSGALNTLQMNGREIYKFAVTKLDECIEGALKAKGLTTNDLAMVLAHQSNARILESARKRIGLPEDKLYINIDRYGNTSAASVPIALHEVRASGKLKDGDIVLFVGLGGGLTWASSLWQL